MSRDFLDHARVEMSFLKSHNRKLLSNVMQLESDVRSWKKAVLILSAALLVTWVIFAVHAL